MSFFPFITHHHASAVPAAVAGGSLAPLFRLFDDLESVQQPHCSRRSNISSSSSSSSKNHTAAQRTFTPRFDVREFDDAYELYGELPGVEQADVNIEFADDETLTISGRSQREQIRSSPTETITSGRDALAGAEQQQLQQQLQSSDETASNSHQASVADAVDEDGDFETVSHASATATPAASHAGDAEHDASSAAPAIVTAARPASQPAQADTRPAEPRSRFWLAERSVGTFQRAFHFPARIDQDAVTARLHNGLLSLRVPKARKPEPRRVAIL